MRSKDYTEHYIWNLLPFFVCVHCTFTQYLPPRKCYFGASRTMSTQLSFQSLHCKSCTSLNTSGEKVFILENNLSTVHKLSVNIFVFASQNDLIWSRLVGTTAPRFSWARRASLGDGTGTFPADLSANKCSVHCNKSTWQENASQRVQCRYRPPLSLLQLEQKIASRYSGGRL